MALLACACGRGPERGGGIVSNKESIFTFGDRVKNVWCSEGNPYRSGIFVRVLRRHSGKQIEITDGKGAFWSTAASAVVHETMPEEDSKRLRDALWLTEHWRFLTRDQREQHASECGIDISEGRPK
jgi:hypothetical protein